MNIHVYTSNNPDKPGYYAEVVNSVGETVYTTAVYLTEIEAKNEVWFDWASID